MANSRKASVLGLCSTAELDSGTLCRAASPVPSLLGTAPLQFEDLKLDENLHFRLTIQEALRRGADNAALNLLKHYHQSAAFSSKAPDALEPLRRQLASMTIDSIVWQEAEAFTRLIGEEVNSLPDGFVGDTSGVKDEDDYRFRVRPIYHSYGYTSPADVLKNAVDPVIWMMWPLPCFSITGMTCWVVKKKPSRLVFNFSR